MKTPTALLFAIVEAACELRDAEAKDVGTKHWKALDAAVDAWREHLLRVRVEKPEFVSRPRR